VGEDALDSPSLSAFKQFVSEFKEKRWLQHYNYKQLL
jgi:hypothetical protein